MSTKAKLFVNGRSQAVRIPKEFAFNGVDAVLIEKQGNALVLTPARSTWLSFAELAPAADDFMVLRPRLLKTQSARPEGSAA
jgi:antitoxin VapB